MSGSGLPPSGGARVDGIRVGEIDALARIGPSEAGARTTQSAPRVRATMLVDPRTERGRSDLVLRTLISLAASNAE